jgi:hypothetical protein
MNTDLPLEKNEDDKLGRLGFAKEIANGLVNSFRENNESVVLGINGNWGSGKSTLINFIMNEVELLSNKNNYEIITLRFNPWMFSGQNELQNIFLKEMFLKLEANKEKLKDASKKIADFLGHFNWLKYVHSGAGEAVSDAKIFLEGLNKTKDLAQLKKDVDEILIKAKVKLYITIDDIDRLTPSEITDIFQLVKLNGNFANTIFILAYDQNVVVSALKNQFGDNGKKYIEKIVQIDYTLPPISSQNITRIFIDSLFELFPDGNIRKQIVEKSEIIKTKPLISFFTSLRDIYRFNNSLKLRLPSIYNDLNIIDFLLIESLRMFNYEAYEFIINNKENLVYKKEHTSYGKTPYRKSPKDFIDETTFDKNTKKIINDLFGSGVVNYSNFTDNDELIREKRVINTNYFDRYFNLQLSSFDIQEYIFEEFIHTDSFEKKTSILDKIVSDEKLFNFLNYLKIKSLKSKNEEIECIISTCLKYSQKVKFTSESFWGYDTDFMTLIRFCSSIIDRIPDLEVRRQLILNHLTNANYGFSVFFISDSILNAKNSLDENKLSYLHLWFDLFKHIIEDRNIYKDSLFIKGITRVHEASCKYLFEKEIDENDFLNEDELSSILFYVKKYYPSFYKNNFLKIIKNDNNLVKVVWMCFKRNVMNSSNVVGPCFQLVKNQLIEGLNPNEIKSRFEKIDTQSIDENKKKVVNFYLKAYLDGFVENRYYNMETLEAYDR